MSEVIYLQLSIYLLMEPAVKKSFFVFRFSIMIFTCFLKSTFSLGYLAYQWPSDDNHGCFCNGMDDCFSYCSAGSLA